MTDGEKKIAEEKQINRQIKEKIYFLKNHMEKDKTKNTNNPLFLVLDMSQIKSSEKGMRMFFLGLQHIVRLY